MMRFVSRGDLPLGQRGSVTVLTAGTLFLAGVLAFAAVDVMRTIHAQAVAQAAADAAALAARAGLPLTLFSVVAVHGNWFVPEAARPEEETVPVEVRKDYQEALDRALAGLPDGVAATGELLYGEVVDELSVVGDRGVDLLVCGSRGYGPVRRVLLGTVSAALVRQASVPVLVVPRGGG